MDGILHALNQRFSHATKLWPGVAVDGILHALNQRLARDSSLSTSGKGVPGRPNASAVLVGDEGPAAKGFASLTQQLAVPLHNGNKSLAATAQRLQAGCFLSEVMCVIATPTMRRTPPTANLGKGKVKKAYKPGKKGSGAALNSLEQQFRGISSEHHCGSAVALLQRAEVGHKEVLSNHCDLELSMQGLRVLSCSYVTSSARHRKAASSTSRGSLPTLYSLRDSNVELQAAAFTTVPFDVAPFSTGAALPLVLLSLLYGGQSGILDKLSLRDMKKCRYLPSSLDAGLSPASATGKQRLRPRGDLSLG